MIAFRFEGREVEAPQGMSVAAALLAAGVVHLRDAPADGTPRGAFCMMGLCQECVVLVDGVAVEACRLPASPGLDVRAAGTGR